MTRLLVIPSRFVVAGLLFASAVAGTGLAAAPGEIKIGCILTLTGGGEAPGRAARLALEDHVSQVNAQGGIKGRKIQLIVYDDKDSWNEATSCGARLLDQDRVAGIVGPEWSFAAYRLAPLAESAKVPVIATTATWPGVTGDVPGAPRPYMFRACLTDPAEVAALADYSFHELGKRQAAILFDNQTFNGVEFTTQFESEFNRLGGKVVASANYSLGVTSDFKTQLARLGAAKPDCLLVPFGSYPQLAQIARQARASGLQVPFLGGDSWAVNELLARGGKDIEGAIFTTGLSTEDPQFADFNARFLQDHGVRCETSAYYALDAVMALEHAARVSLEKTGKITPAAMKGALENMKSVAVFTGKMTMDPRTHNPRNQPVLVVTVKDGRQRILKTYKPQ